MRNRRDRGHPRPVRLGLAAAGLVLSLSWPAAADSSMEVYRAMGLEPGQVLAGTVLSSQVLGGGGKQVVAVVTYFTGKRSKAEAVNVRLGVFRRAGATLVPVLDRDFGAERGGWVANGELQVVDLNGDGVNEIVVSVEDVRDPLVQQRLGEVLEWTPSGFRPVWKGIVKYDATRAARKVPKERRDAFEREVDVPATLRSRGRVLVVRKKVRAVAGERLDTPKEILETFPYGAEAP